VGKTKLVERYLKQEYSPALQSTSALTRYRDERGGRAIELWDTPGQEAHRHLCIPDGQSGDDDPNSAILIFDATRKSTYKSLPMWLQLIRGSYPEIPVVVAANKIELDPAKIDVTFAFATKNELELFPVSAVEGIKVAELFERAIQNAVEHRAKVERGR